MLSNPSGQSIEAVRAIVRQIRPNLEFFNALSARLPDLHFPDFNAELDLPLHEFFDVGTTDDVPDDLHGRSIDHLLDEIENAGL